MIHMTSKYAVESTGDAPAYRRHPNDPTLSGRETRPDFANLLETHWGTATRHFRRHHAQISQVAVYLRETQGETMP